ncbi:MAG TPA: amidase family protein, partial [Paracoccaceae bacterium]|nr:amidase family protein [Paracoccaceae bacterium]
QIARQLGLTDTVRGVVVNAVDPNADAGQKGLRRGDIILSATLAEPPARVGRFSHDTEDYVAFRTGPEGIFAYSPFCAAFNASGQPAASVPLAMSQDGLPIGIHLAARFGDDETLIALCAELEQAAPWAGRVPPLHA